MVGRTRVDQHEPRDGSRASAALQTPARPPDSPEALLALQRSAGNQATAAMLARMGNDGDGGQQGGGWYLNGAWLRSWLVYLRVLNPPAPTPTVTEPESESESESESGYETAPEGEPEVTAQTTAVTQQAVTQQAAVTTPTSDAPSIAASPKASSPLGEGERYDLITQRRKLESAAESLEGAAAKEIRILCRTIDKLLEKSTVSDAELKELEDAIKTTLAQSRKTKRQVSSSSSKETEAESAPAERRIVMLYGTEIGADPAGWGPYRATLTRVIGEIGGGAVTFGTDFRPVPNLSVVAHWQGGEGQHFVKVQLDAEAMGGGSLIRGYFRYKIFADRIVFKLVAIRREHSGGKNTTLYGDHRDVIGPDGT